MRTTGIIALLMVLMLVSGCGSAAVGAALLFMPEKSEDTEPLNVEPDAPVAIISAMSGIYSGDIDISYTLTDINSDSIYVVVEYSLDSGASYTTVVTESLDPQSEGTTALASTPTGIAHLFVWDSLADMGSGTVDTVRFRITPYDSLAGVPAETSIDFTVDNTAPVVAIKGFDGSQSGKVTVAYKITDGASDDADIIVEYSIDEGTTYFPATEDILSAFTEGTTQLASSPGGILHIFVWDSVVDCPGFRCPDEDGERTVRIRITPSDVLSGLPVATPNFALDNNIPPTVVVLTPGAPLPKKGNVQIEYTLADPEGDDCAITVLYAVNGGSWGAAIRGSGGDPLTGLTSSATGVTHTFIWNSIANLGYCSETEVLIAIIPRDFKEGSSGATDLFTVNNNLAPSAVIVTPAGEKSGAIYLLYYLFDGGSDKIDIEAHVTLDSGQTWTTATLHSSAIEGTTDLDSAPTGYPHFFLWDSDADMPGVYSSDIVFRIKPTDEFSNEGDPALSDPFTVANNSPPSVNITTDPPSPSAGEITITYDLLDAESQACTLVVEYQAGVGADWLPATMAASSEPTTQRTSSVSGDTHTYIWDSAKDIDILVRDVRIRITPYDFPGRSGTYDTTAVFNVDNSHWSVPFEITSSGSSSLWPAVHASPEGQVHVVWVEYVSSYDIFYARKSGGQWSTPLEISSSTSHCWYPEVVAGSNGTVHVVWAETDYKGDDQAMYRKFDGSQWLDIEKLTNSSDDINGPTIDLDQNNNPWIGYSRRTSYYNVYSITHDGIDWSSEELIGWTSTNYVNPKIRSGPDRQVMHVGYRRTVTPGRVYYAEHAGVSWTIPDTIVDLSNITYYPDLSIDNSSKAHVVYTYYDRAYYSTNQSGSWAVPVSLSNTIVNDTQVAANEVDDVHVVWCEDDETIYYRHFDGSTWSVQDKVDIGYDDARSPFMRKGLDGRIHLVYHEWDGYDWQIWYTRR